MKKSIKAEDTAQRALISGAGIAGLTAAYWLIKIGWEVVVLEKASALREGEFVIDFSGTGWDVAVEMGLEEAIRNNQMEINALCFKNAKGQHRARIAMKDFIESMGVADKHASINRRVLQNLIFDKVKDDIDIRFASSIHSLKENDEGVHVVMEDGREEVYDLVIGADGLHSNVRKLAFGPDAQFARYLGYHVSAFRVRAVSGEEPGLMNVLRKPNKQAGILDLRDGDALALFVFANKNEAYVPRDQRPQILKDTFSDLGGQVPSILTKINDETVIYMDTTTQIKMPTWHTKRIVLIGDAAYCLTLVSGQGASMAMAGAYVLAKALENRTDAPIAMALAQYETRLRPFVESLQDKSKKFAGEFIPGNRFGLWITNLMVFLIKIPLVKRYVGKLFSIQSLFEQEARG